MSMRSWTENGFGMLLYTGKNGKQIYDFLVKCNPELAPTREEIKNDKELQDALENGNDLSYILEDYLGEPASWYIASEINKAEGTTVFSGYMACGDTDQEEMIGIAQCYPWEMNEKDRSLTKDKACELLNKYAEILGIDEVPEYFEAEYYG